MATIAEFHQEMLSLHRRTGVAAGYWPGYFLRSVRQDGGLAVAKRLLAKPTSEGFEKLEEVKRMDLSIEYLVVDGHYAHLFTLEELEIARQRLARIPGSSFPGYSDGPATLGEVADGASYLEGTTVRVLVNPLRAGAEGESEVHRTPRHMLCNMQTGL